MRLIDADALHDSINKETYRHTYIEQIHSIIDNAPTIDAKPIVRCKDCEHRYGNDCPMYYEEWFTIDEGGGFYDSDFRIIDETQDDGFCYQGKRREP